MKKVKSFLIVLAILFTWTTSVFAMLEKDFFVGEIVQVKPQKNEIILKTKEGLSKTFILDDVHLGELWKGKEVLISTKRGSNVADSVMLTKYGE